MKKHRYDNVAEMTWDLLDGYRGKSRKWARRRSKCVMHVVKRLPRSPDVERLYRFAGGK